MNYKKDLKNLEIEIPDGFYKGTIVYNHMVEFLIEEQRDEYMLLFSDIYADIALIRKTDNIEELKSVQDKLGRILRVLNK